MSSSNEPAVNKLYMLTGRRALVTGSTSGIGAAIASKLAAAGAEVIVHGRSPSDHCSELVSKLKANGLGVSTVFGDFSQRGELERVAAEAWKIHDGLDILINNAGGDVLTGQWAESNFSDRLDYLWEVDVRSTLLLSRRVGGQMAAQPGGESGSCCIVNMGWDQAAQGMAGESGEMFSTTKGAIMAMSRSLAQSLAPIVRVNCLAPGWIRTKWAEGASPHWQDRAKQQSLMNRWGRPDDIAEAACFLCSDSARFISGQILPVNGGFCYFPLDSE